MKEESLGVGGGPTREARVKRAITEWLENCPESDVCILKQELFSEEIFFSFFVE